MATVLKLNDSGTRAAIRTKGLNQRKRVGRGTYCAVYEGAPGSVLKLTADPMQRESLVFYLTSPAFPRLIQDHGYAGTQGENVDLWLLETERLEPLARAPKALKAEARALLGAVDKAIAAQGCISAHRPGWQQRRAERDRKAVASLLDDSSVATYHEALEQLLSFMREYDRVLLDFHQKNLMVRDGQHLILNDVVCDSAYLS